jgi:hypothetical protein
VDSRGMLRACFNSERPTDETIRDVNILKKLPTELKKQNLSPV